ncbi:MAG TPA: hypothetical protein VFQ54_04650 [Thermomicrobiales bacterium]|nr:hypothetical protein [Thermomicrobiales bacterium]
MNARRLSIVTLFCLLASVFAGITPVAAQGSRSEAVTASAYCQAGSKISITLRNTFGLPIVVTSVNGFAPAADLNLAFIDSNWTPTLERTIQNGDWVVLESTSGSEFGGAIVVTTAGVLMPTCDGRTVGLWDDPGQLPRTDGEAQYQAIAIAAMTIGRLESVRDYSALYELLHPDVRAHVPYAGISCWYEGVYGTPDDWKDSVFGTSVDDITMIDGWVWPAGNVTYDNVAEVTTTQRIGTMSDSSDVRSTSHLVQSGGVWRWFFGTKVDSINQLYKTCGL